MICEDMRCIFVHIPKVAGQSIEHFFLNVVHLTWETRHFLLLRYNDNPELGPKRLAHLTASEYTRYGYIEQDKFDSFFKFVFVRNPWDRILSEYRYRRYAEKFDFDFKSFLFDHLPKPSHHSDEYRHIMPQYEFVFDKHGNQLVNFVGRYENLQDDFNEVCKALHIEHTILPRTNRSKDIGNFDSITRIKNTLLRRFFRIELSAIKKQQRRSVLSFYDDETIEFVGHLYKQDILTFNYSFDELRTHTPHNSEYQSNR